MAKGVRKYDNYREYVDHVVKNCGHNYVMMQTETYRKWKINKYYGAKDELPKGKHIKVVPARCKSYSCPICGSKKIKDLFARLRGKNLSGYRFFTLTLKNKYTKEDTERNLTRITECFNKLNKALRKHPAYKKLQYFRVIEIGSNGNVHMHGIWNIYIPQEIISTLWKKITGDSYRCKLERIRSKGDAFKYLFKYITKDACKDYDQYDSHLFGMDLINASALFYENGKRRFQASRNFFPKEVESTDNKWELYYFENVERRSVEVAIKNEVDEHGLKLENFDLDCFYGSDTFLESLFFPKRE